MPSKSPAQHRLMEAAAHTPGGYGGVPQSVGKEFVNADKRADDAKKPRCAGLLLRANDQYLLVRRVENGIWEHPGGHIEDGETAEQAAIREAIEEVSLPYSIEPKRLRHQENGPVDYSTFFADVKRFNANLSDEHTTWGWFGAASLPSPIHPEVLRSIAYVEHDLQTELDAAFGVRDGRLPSGFKYENTHLVALRIFGTGVSYRTKFQEFTFRDPEIYQSEETLARCNGLPVVIEHPPEQMLNADEYEARNIGAVMLPYIKNDEVWGIARVYDSEIAEILASGELSTSPGVRLGEEGNGILPLGEERLLVEGNPKLIDHIAIVPNGVWDKGGPPSGLRNDSMADEKEGERKYGDVKFADPANDKYPIDTDEHIRAAWDYIHKGKDADKYSADDLAAVKRRIVSAWKDKIDPNGPPEADKKDENMPEKDSGAKAPHEELLDAIKGMGERIDAICSRVDSIEGKRMDGAETEDEKSKREAEEKERKDAEEAERAEKERKDAEEAEKRAQEEKNKQDAGAAENAVLRQQIADMQAKLDNALRPPSHEDLEAVHALQSRADGVLQLHGKRAPQPMHNESARSYRLRVLAGMRPYSDRFKDIQLDKLDGAVLDEIERGIFNDAQSMASNPKNAPAGRLIPIRTVENGHQVTRYHGDPAATFAAFTIPGRSFTVNNPRRGGSN